MEKIILIAVLALGVVIGLALPGPPRDNEIDKTSRIATLEIG